MFFTIMLINCISVALKINMAIQPIPMKPDDFSDKYSTLVVEIKKNMVSRSSFWRNGEKMITHLICIFF